MSRIIQACANHDFHITANDAYRAWRAYSEVVCAGWLLLPEDDESIVHAVSRYCVECD